MQSITALTMACAAPGIALASADSADTSSRKKRWLRIDRVFVLFPINNESSSRRVRLVKNGRVLRSFTASLGLPAQWWAHLDVSEWQGQTLTLSIEPDNTPPIGGMKIAGSGASETEAQMPKALRLEPYTRHKRSTIIRKVMWFRSRGASLKPRIRRSCIS